MVDIKQCPGGIGPGQVRVDGESALQVFLRLAPARFHGRCTVVKLRQQLGAGGKARPGICVVGLDVQVDVAEFGGSGVGNPDGVETTPIDAHGQNQSILITVPPLGAIALAGT